MKNGFLDKKTTIIIVGLFVIILQKTIGKFGKKRNYLKRARIPVPFSSG